MAVAVGLAATLTMIVAVGYGLSRREPEWWARAAEPGPGEENGDGEELQNSVINQLHLSRGTEEGLTAAELAAGEAWRSEPWRVSLRDEDVNAWVAEELPRWLANRDPPVRWPEQVESARVGFDHGVVMVGVRLRHGGASGVISASVISVSLVPELRADGSLWLRASWVRIGSLPAPASWVVARLRDALEEGGLSEQAGREAEFMLRVLAGEEALTSEPVVRLEDGRRVRLLDLEARPGEVWLTARTEQSP